MEPQFFTSAGDWRAWLEANHASARETLVGFYKRGAGIPGITYAEALDQALCFGWIDGVRRNVDQARWSIRFTPRKPGSVWSQINTGRVYELTQQGLMHPAGIAAFERRDEAKSRQYSYENRPASLGDPYEAEFRASPDAWAYFEAQPPHYRRAATWWVLSAKREETRQRRLKSLIETSVNGAWIPQMISPSKRRNSG